MKVDLPPDRPRLAITMADGAEAVLSPLRPDDGMLLVEGLEELSPESRYSRFGFGRAGLTAGEVEYLADVDQKSHVAWGVLVDGDGAGVGRYIGLRDRGSAEVAVTVLDRFQRRGVGRLLFEALVAVARADGLTELRFEVSPDNEAVKSIIQGLEVVLDGSDGELTGRVSVSEIPAGPHEEALCSVMSQARAQSP